MGNFLFDFLQKNRRIIISLIAILVPIAASILFGIVQGAWIGDYYLPSSQWNDEVLYFKQVEAVVEHGFPRGFFGYNESSAEYLTFSAWSPVIMGAYVLWGALFGWSYSAPVYCNVLLICIGLAFFAAKADLGYKQMGLLTGFVILFTPLSRFMLSCMADCEIIFVLMIYMGLYVNTTKAVAEKRNPSVGNIVGLLVSSSFLTLMRPYFLLLYIFPGYFYYKRKKSGAIVVTFVAGLTMVAYAYIAQKFTAAYFFPLIDTDWIKGILDSPVRGIKDALRVFVYGLFDIARECLDGIQNGNMEGSLWCLFITLFVVVAMFSIREKNYRAWLFVLVALLGAIVMFYDIRVGSRHLMPFVILVAFLLCCSRYRKTFVAVIGITVLLFTCRITSDSYNYEFPVYNEQRGETIESLQEQLAEKMVVNTSGDYWDNTVVWLFSDETVVTWQNLYALPCGMGINLCMPEYVLENKDDLRSKYIVVNVGEPIDLMMDELQAEKIAEESGFAVWQLRE